MRPKASESEGHQLELGTVLLESFINMKDELVILGNVIDWEHFCKTFGESFHESQGPPRPSYSLNGGINLSEVSAQFIR